RIHFDSIEEYASYARSVVAAETGGLALAREVAFLGVANSDDAATQLSRKNLVGPLADLAASWTDVPGWSVSRHFDADASKATVAAARSPPSATSSARGAIRSCGARGRRARRRRSWRCSRAR